MGRWLKRIGIGLLVLTLVAGGAALRKRQEIGRLIAVNTLFEPQNIVANFSHMDRAFLKVPLPGSAAAPLPAGPALMPPPGFDAWIDRRAITGLVVLRGGKVAFEGSYLGTRADDRRISWSVAKSFLSLLTGILIDEGALALTDPVTRHAPLLAGSAYDGATVEDVLQMESGVRFDENYFRRGSDINRMGRTVALGGSLDAFTAALKERTGTPGDSWAYVSMDTHVVGMVLRGATARTIPDLMTEKLTGPMGLADGYYLTDGDGVAFVLGGLNLTTLDYARMGLMVAQGGRLAGRQIVPRDWIEVSTRPSARTQAGAMQYGYQWWMPPDTHPGEVMAQGIYGQYVYIDRMRDVVIAVNAADRGFAEAGVSGENISMFRAIAVAR